MDVNRIGENGHVNHVSECESVMVKLTSLLGSDVGSYFSETLNDPCMNFFHLAES